MVIMNDTANENKHKNKRKTSSQPDSFVEDLNSSKPDLSNTKGYNPFGLIGEMKKKKEKKNL
jgi:hypothetical protein